MTIRPPTIRPTLADVKSNDEGGESIGTVTIMAIEPREHAAWMQKVSNQGDLVALTTDFEAHKVDTSTHGVGTIAGLTETQTLTNKTLTTPTIGDFTNSEHDHEDASGGGKIDHGAALDGLADDDHTQYVLSDGSRDIQYSTGDWAVGNVSGGNYTKIESDGTMVAVGDATTWDDSTAATYYMRTGGTALTQDVLAGGIYQYRYDLNDEVHSQIQLSHRMKVGSNIHAHVHLINKNAIGATGYNVGIVMEWGWVSIGQVMPTPTTESTVNCSFQNASALTHKVFELKTITPTAAQGGISSIFFVRLKRVAGTTKTYNTNDIFIAGFDIHVEQDTTGSRQEYSK